jgi:eukaryotic-like serine/threonine-protein kinase
MSQPYSEPTPPEPGSKPGMASAGTDLDIASKPACAETIAVTSPDMPSDPEATKAYVPELVSSATLPRIPGYEITGILGQGGMGIVYKARHLALNRPVALKMIRTGQNAEPGELIRFKSEAQAAARLQHPNIVQVFEVGEHAGLPFFALELVDGGTLAAKLAQRLPSPTEVAGLVETLAQAMHFAHCRNVIHRDLKPANVLLTADGVPKVTDFGLARQLDADSSQTRTGVIMGTPSYMAPEQASGQTHAAGPAADVYALGAILYALLTGQPPFKGATSLETLDQVRGQEPVAPSRLQARLPRDLETICLKCLAKEPERRYASAQELAEDLRRFQNGEPIRARPVGNGERLWRWARRNPTVAALIALVHVLALAGLGGIVSQWREAVIARGEAQTKAEAEAQAKRHAELTIADMYTAHGMLADANHRPAQAVLWFAQAAKQAGLDKEREHANRVRFMTWERQTFQPVAALKVPAEWLNQIVFCPVPHATLGSRYLLTQVNLTPPLLGSGEWMLWDLQTEAVLPFPSELGVVTAAAWNPKGDLLALGNDKGDVRLLEFKSLQPKSPWGKVHHGFQVKGAVYTLTFDPKGQLLAVASTATARVWDLERADFATPELAAPAVALLSFDGEGKRLMVAARDHKVRLYAVSHDSAEPLWGAGISVPHLRRGNNREHRLVPALFVNGDSDILTQPTEGTLTWIDAATGKPRERTLTFPSYFTALATDAGGRVVAISGSKWDTQVGENHVHIVDAGESDIQKGPIQLPHRARTFMMSMTFNSASQSLLTACSDGTVQLWAMPGGTPIGPPLLHPTHVQHAIFAPDPRWIATVQRGGLVSVWKVPQSGLDAVRLTHDSGGSFARVSPNGKYVLPTGTSFNVCTLTSPNVFDLETGKIAGKALRGEGIVIDGVFSPDGDQVILARSTAQHTEERKARTVIPKGAIEFWNWRTGMTIRESMKTDAEPRALAFSPTKPTVLAVLCADGQLLVVDTATGATQPRKVHEPSRGASAFLNNGKVRFSPDGQFLLTWGTDSRLRFWDAASLKPACELAAQGKDLFTDVQFSPDHRFLMAGSRDNVVRIWDWKQGRPDSAPPLAVLKHPDWPHVAVFSPDGKSVLTGCRDKQARLWDWQSGKLVWSVTHDHEVHAVAFNPGGDWVLTACDDKTLRVWDAARGIPLTPALPLSGEGGSLTVTPDGKYVVVGCFGKSIDVYRLNGLQADTIRNVDDLCRWAELLSGQSVHSAGNTTLLTTEKWFDQWREFRDRRQEP